MWLRKTCRTSLGAKPATDSEREGLEGGIGAGIEKHDPVVRLKCDRGDYSGVAEVTGIENVDHSLRILNALPYSHSMVAGGLLRDVEADAVDAFDFVDDAAWKVSRADS